MSCAQRVETTLSPILSSPVKTLIPLVEYLTARKQSENGGFAGKGGEIELKTAPFVCKSRCCFPTSNPPCLTTLGFIYVATKSASIRGPLCAFSMQMFQSLINIFPARGRVLYECIRFFKRLISDGYNQHFSFRSNFIARGWD